VISRRALIVAALTLAPLAVPGSAAALVSQITTPSNLTYTFAEPSSKITIEGTASVVEVDVRCYYGAGELSYRIAANKVPVTAGKFSVEALTSSFGRDLCQLRAVPTGAKLALPPETKQEYEGPILVPSQFLPTNTNYIATADTLVGNFEFESAGFYSLESELYSPTAHASFASFFGEVSLPDIPEYPAIPRSQLQVDGVNAYAPAAAARLQSYLKLKAPIPGTPSIAVTKSFNESTHLITVNEEDPIVSCSPSSAVYPPTSGSCTSLVPSGVTLDRTWQTTNEDHVAWMTEAWRSNDGHAHAVNARYYNEMTSEEPQHGVYELPGSSSFSETHKGETKALPAGAGAILYKTNPTVPEAGDGVHPQAAIVYDKAPSEPLAFVRGSVEESPSVFELPYQITVPAGGSSPTLRMAFVQGFALTEVKALAETALASYYPTVAIGSPTNGTIVTTPAATITGTASDAVALSSLTVNGKAVSVGAGGAWSTSVSLSPGANTITATATNQSGLSKSASETVTYTPPPPPATASQVGTVSGARGQVTFTLACHGAAGTICTIHAALTTVEKLRHGHLVGIVAARTRSRTVTVASRTLLIPAGLQVKVTIKLNALGRRLLARFHRLPAHLAVLLAGVPASTVVITQNITVRPAPKKRHRHH
jgi:hypothetical protein